MELRLYYDGYWWHVQVKPTTKSKWVSLRMYADRCDAEYRYDTYRRQPDMLREDLQKRLLGDI